MAVAMYCLMRVVILLVRLAKQKRRMLEVGLFKRHFPQIQSTHRLDGGADMINLPMVLQR